MSPILTIVRPQSQRARVVGAFMASLGVHAALVVVVLLAWPVRSPVERQRPPTLVVELVPPAAPLFAEGVARTAAPTDVVAPVPRTLKPSVAAAPASRADAAAEGARAAVVSTTAPAPDAAVPALAVPSSAARPVLPPQPVSPAPPRVDDGSAGAAGGDPDELVRAWLAMHQHYPRAARRHRIEGTVTLAFALDARGRVVRAEVDGTSGSRVLDRAALDLLGRAEPFPVAASDATAELPFEIELEYRLASLEKR